MASWWARKGANIYNKVMKPPNTAKTILKFERASVGILVDVCRNSSMDWQSCYSSKLPQHESERGGEDVENNGNGNNTAGK